MLAQAEHFGAEMVYSPVNRIRVEKDGMKVVETDAGEYRAPAVIVTAGGNPRKLDVPGEMEFAGRGVSYCAVCDGAFFEGLELAVIGGGDAAVEEAMFLTRYASKVTIIHRREEFRAQPILMEEARDHPKIDILVNKVVESIEGEQKVSHVQLRDVVTGESIAARRRRRLHLRRLHPQHRAGRPARRARRRRLLPHRSHDHDDQRPGRLRRR